MTKHNSIIVGQDVNGNLCIIIMSVLYQGQIEPSDRGMQLPYGYLKGEMLGYYTKNRPRVHFR